MNAMSEHRWVGDVCVRCRTRREPVIGRSAFKYRGGRATIKGRRLLEGIGTSAREHDVICVPPEVRA